MGRRLEALLPLVETKPDRAHLDEARASTRLAGGQAALTDPAHDAPPTGRLRRPVDNPDAPSVPKRSPRPWTGTRTRTPIFTSDTGMATVWLSRFVTMTGTGG